MNEDIEWLNHNPIWLNFPSFRIIHNCSISTFGRVVVEYDDKRPFIVREIRACCLTSLSDGRWVGASHWTDNYLANTKIKHPIDPSVADIGISCHISIKFRLPSPTWWWTIKIYFHASWNIFSKEMVEVPPVLHRGSYVLAYWERYRSQIW